MLKNRDFSHPPHLHSMPTLERGSEYCYKVTVWCGKKQNGVATRRKSLRLCLLVLIQYTNVTDRHPAGRTDRHAAHDGIGRACA